MTSYTKISLGNGKFCYSGPNCRQHGTKATVSSEVENLKKPLTAERKPATQEFIDDTKARIDEEMKVLFTKSRQVICETSNDMASLEEMGGEALLTGKAAHSCELHGVYHVYRIQDLDSLASSVRAELRNLYISKIEARTIAIEQVRDISEYLATTSRTTIVSVTGPDKKTLKRFQESIKGTTFEEAALVASEAEKTLARKRSIWAPKPVLPYSPPLLDANKVEDSQMLRYWQCGRKVQYPSVSSADIEVSKQNDAELGSYACSHCNKFHVGHGDGKSPVSEQLVRARTHWMERPEKSNMFAFANNLI